GCLVRDRDKRISSVGELGRVVARYATTITGSGMYRSSLFERPDQLGDVVGVNSPQLSYGGPQVSYGGPQVSYGGPQLSYGGPQLSSPQNAPSVPAFNPYSRQTPTDRDPHPLASGRIAPSIAGPSAFAAPPTVAGAPDFSGAPFAPGQPGISPSTTLASETPNTRPGSGAGVHAAWGATDAGQKKR